MNIRKVIRLILKIPATPVVLAWYLLGYVTIQVARTFEWIYEASNDDKESSLRFLNNHIKKPLKKWFTTV
jgi:hypothetical protein